MVEDQGLPASVPWGPHVYELNVARAWHVMPELPISSAWFSRMRAAAKRVPKLRLGVAAPLTVLNKPDIILALDELQCSILPVKETEAGAGYRSLGIRESICDVIYEHRLVLEPSLTRTILDRCLERALKAQDSYKKGARLELLIAVMLSQVIGFEVTDKNILSKNQEIDVHVTNRNSAGPLGRGQYVLAEGKNWKAPVPRREYDAFAKKVRTRRGMAKLGLMVTTSSFEKGVYIEAIRDSEHDELVVLLDKVTFPKVWRDFDSVTGGLEHAITRAVYDHEPE
ncbi:MAG: restriction endonuclease [Burkholderiaceae bacterium]|nr:restriction endonuclease [Burkholderiaceae bacterium]